MPAIRRRSVQKAVTLVTLATADDLNGTVDGTQYADLSGGKVAIITQINSGTAGTAGVDVIEVSHDGGISWIDDPTLLLLSADPHTGTVEADADLNAAGVEPTGAAQYKSGPHRGPTLLRCARGGTGAQGTAWVTGAPAVTAAVVG